MLMQRLLLAVFIAFATRAALACSFTVIDSLKMTFQRADVVFVGRVVGIADFEATLDLTESLKGPQPEQFVVSFASSCDYGSFEVGKVYLVIANQDRATLRAGLGSYTTELTPETQRRVQLVRERAAWWRSAPSRFAPFRALTFMWRSLRYSISSLLEAESNPLRTAQTTGWKACPTRGRYSADSIGGID